MSSNSAPLKPELLARLNDLPLIASLVASGVLNGHHDSIQKGSGIEFSQYRAYEPGDPLQRIDWKLFARSDRYFVREAQRESDINVWLVLDCSASMQFCDEGNSVSKMQFGKWLLATLAHIGFQQGDAVGALSLSAESCQMLKPATGRRQLTRCLVELERLKTGGLFPTATQLKRVIGETRKNALIFVVSDFYQQGNEIFEAMSQMASRHSQVVGIQLETAQEVNFDYQGAIEFVDYETDERLRVNPSEVRSQYLRNRRQLKQHLEHQLQSIGGLFHCIRTDEPMDRTLRNLLLRLQHPQSESFNAN